MARLRDLLNHKQSPVVLGAATVALVISVAFYLRTSAVDPRVSLEERRASSESGQRPVFVPGAARLAAAINGEVVRTADRRAEATALAFSAEVYLGTARLKGGLPRDVQTLLSGLTQNGLMPPGLMPAGSAGTL